jgi:two-component system chemotaxis response regulator CheB
MSRLRVLVAEDSLTVRKRLVEVLAGDPGLAVVGEAQDGREAVELCRRLRPDVVTLDMMMPVMTGLEATEHIMAYCPTPILVVSASTNRGELFRTYDALAAGAIDVLDKPRGSEPGGDWEARLVAAVKLIAKIKVITHPRAKLRSIGHVAAPPAASIAPPLRAPATRASLVAIGGSTGSPGAVLEILGALPRDLAAPVLLVVHINEPFGAAFADWLDQESPLTVRYAREGERPWGSPGTVLMAPPGRHLAMDRGVLRLQGGEERHCCKPSVDVLFESLAREVGAGALACLLTGMGRDGAEGMLALRRAGAATIAQDEATSVVFGMPREAILLGAAGEVLPLHEIGPAIAAAVSGRRAPP